MEDYFIECDLLNLLQVFEAPNLDSATDLGLCLLLEHIYEQIVVEEATALGEKTRKFLFSCNSFNMEIQNNDKDDAEEIFVGDVFHLIVDPGHFSVVKCKK